MLAREQQIIVLFASGATTITIGKIFGVSKQRIQKILSKNGIKRKNGGASVYYRQAAKPHLQQMAELSLRSEKLFFDCVGCSHEEYKKINRKFKNKNSSSPAKVFSSQRGNSKTRGIRWELNFFQWWTLWEKSGKWNQRGRKKGNYVMARNEDKGPYALGNVKIITNTSNIKEHYNRVRKIP